MGGPRPALAPKGGDFNVTKLADEMRACSCKYGRLVAATVSAEPGAAKKTDAPGYCRHVTGASACGPLRDAASRVIAAIIRAAMAQWCAP